MSWVEGPFSWPAFGFFEASEIRATCALCHTVDFGVLFLHLYLLSTYQRSMSACFFVPAGTLNTRCMWAGGIFLRCPRKKVPRAHSRSACVLQELGWKYTYTISNFVQIFLLRPNFLLVHRNRYSEGMVDGQKTPRGHPDFNSYVKNLCDLVFWMDAQTETLIRCWLPSLCFYFFTFATIFCVFVLSKYQFCWWIYRYTLQNNQNFICVFVKFYSSHK